METVENQSFQELHTTQSENCSKPVYSRSPNLPKVKTVEISPSKTPTHSQSWKWQKLIQSRPPNPTKNDKNQSFQDHQTIQSGNCWKSVLSRTSHHAKWKLLKISPFKITKSSQSENCWNKSFQDTYTITKLKMSKTNPFKTTKPSQTEHFSQSVLSKTSTTSQIENYTKLDPSKWPDPPKVKLLENKSRLPHPPQMEITENQSFQDHNALLKLKSKIRPFKITTPLQNGICFSSIPSSYHILQKSKLLKISPFKTTTLPKVEIIWNQTFQYYHTLPEGTLF